MERITKAQDHLVHILQQLNSHSGMIEASAIVTLDGVVKTEQLSGGIEPYGFGAMCASLLSLAKRTAQESRCGEIKLVLLEGTSGTMIVVQIGIKGVLAIVTKPEARIGRLFIEARQAAQKIEQYL
ncbi:MAG: roadblock/LC7 domain-containing protein [Cocleimonas sp.]|nr:roadblock/LC7 domain-containing protein [Cocleimonas sp.]